MELQEQVINHLTKEIEIITTNSFAFRTRAAFTVWTGPYLILGSVIIATKGKFVLAISDRMYVPLVIACISYLLLGLIAGLIEQGTLRRCNALRESIIEMCDVQQCALIRKNLPDYKAEFWILKFYVAVFLVIGVSFGSVLVLTSTS